MVLKRYKVVSVVIILCFLSAFFALYNGFSAIIEARNNCKAEIRYGYTHMVSVYVDSNEKINLKDLTQMCKDIKQCNVYLKNLRFYYDENGNVFKPDIILCQNERLPYPLKNNVKKPGENEIIVPDNISFKNTTLNVHNKKITICDEIDTAKCAAYEDTFVLNARTFTDVFSDENETQSLELRICSNKDNIYTVYSQLEKILK